MPSFLAFGQALAKVPLLSALPARISSAARCPGHRTARPSFLLQEVRAIASSGDGASPDMRRLLHIANRDFHLVDAMRPGFSPASPVVLIEGGFRQLGVNIDECQAHVACLRPGPTQALLEKQLLTLRNALDAAIAHWSRKYHQAERSGDTFNAVFAGAVLGGRAQQPPSRTARSCVDVTLTELVRSHRTTLHLDRQTLDRIEQHLHQRYQLDHALECHHDAPVEALAASGSGQLRAARADVVRALHATAEVSAQDVREDLTRELEVQKARLDAAIVHWNALTSDPPCGLLPGRQRLARRWLGAPCEENGPRRVVSWNDLVNSQQRPSSTRAVHWAEQVVSDEPWEEAVPLPDRSTRTLSH